MTEHLFVAAYYALVGSWMDGDDPRMGGVYEVTPADLRTDLEHLGMPPGTAYITPRARILRRFDFSREELSEFIPVAYEMAEQLRSDDLSLRQIATYPAPEGVSPVLFKALVQWCVAVRSWDLRDPNEEVLIEAFALRASEYVRSDVPMSRQQRRAEARKRAKEMAR